MDLGIQLCNLHRFQSFLIGELNSKQGRPLWPLPKAPQKERHVYILYFLLFYLLRCLIIYEIFSVSIYFVNEVLQY